MTDEEKTLEVAKKLGIEASSVDELFAKISNLEGKEKEVARNRADAGMLGISYAFGSAAFDQRPEARDLAGQMEVAKVILTMLGSKFIHS